MKFQFFKKIGLLRHRVCLDNECSQSVILIGGRNSHPEVSYKKGFLKISQNLQECTCQKQPPGMFCKKCGLKDFSIFIEKHLCWILFFNDIAGLKACNFIKKGLQHRCFPVNIAKFLRIPILKNTSGGCF